MKTGLWLLLINLCLFPGAQSRATALVPSFKKVVVVLFENENYEKPMMLPYFTKMSKDGALLTNYHAVGHPSEPNYIALVAGDSFGINDDEIYDLSARHLGDLLEAKGKTWVNYAEDYPGNCFLGAVSGRYVRKHTPFIGFKNVTGKPSRCKKIVNASQFAQDVKNNSLPNFSFFTPNLDNDGHDTGAVYADKWFKSSFEPLLQQPGFKDVLLIVTFDENECDVDPHSPPEVIARCKTDPNLVYTVFYGPQVKAGTVSNVSYTHYSLLKTIEQGFGLADLGKKDKSAKAITDIWK